MVEWLPEKVGSPDVRFRQVDRIRDDGRMSQVVTVSDEVLDELGLIAFRKAIAAAIPA
jgi:hypothetical protein